MSNQKYDTDENIVDELADKEELKQDDFCDSQELLAKGEEVLNEDSCACESSKIDFWQLIKIQTHPSNILKTCYDFVNNINNDERTLLALKSDLEETRTAYDEIKRDVLTDKELMKEWKEEYNITNDSGRLKKIEDDNRGILESIEIFRKKIKNVETELLCNKRLFNLHLEVLKKTNEVKFPYEV